MMKVTNAYDREFEMKNTGVILGLMLALCACKEGPARPVFAKTATSGNVLPASRDTASSPVETVPAPAPATPATPATPTAIEIASQRTEDFTAFIKTTEALDLSLRENQVKIPGLLLNNQFALVERFGERTAGALAQGRCLLFNTTGTAFKTTDISGSGLVVAPLGKIVYTDSKTLAPAECQNLFKTQLALLYTKNFYELHTSYYSFN